MSFTAHVHIQQRPHRQYYCSGFAKTVPTRLYRLFQPERQNLPAGGGGPDPVNRPPGAIRGADEAARRHRAVQRGDAGAGDQIPGAVEPARSPGQGRQGPGSSVRAWGLSRSNPTSKSSSTCCAATATCCGRSKPKNTASDTSSTNSASRLPTGNAVCSTVGIKVFSTRCAATGTEPRTPRATPTRKKATS